ncbi:TetR/AcrR family transcriptional regulator [Bailinhaonella thermotolerans]|uniref:TetR/AcrR family transcriptional regulator n=1 Tax=Bailinhaonella thermotolerans TaxID=1070861 RepID=A0A3A4A799_9ACTN|nr:TetR/AcrR family transcriptional regulator [Bailinhaonella thermotolerans]RJL24455.1 TetR/AcrR family transcriptional regulator [Bailinhaonella thermotolerans]
MPRLWKDTVDAHRQAVRDATLDAVAHLVTEDGLLSVTMSRVAERAGIGRATLYKYFPDVEAVLTAWHAREMARNLERLTAIAERPGSAAERLEAVLLTYAGISHEHHRGELVALLHRGDHALRAHRELATLIGDLIAEGARDGGLRGDVPPSELAAYCLAALTAATELTSREALRRLVAVVMSGLNGGPAPADPL